MIKSKISGDKQNDQVDCVELVMIAKMMSKLATDILLVGETGTGKDTVAQRIHKLSGRKGRMVAMNCAAIPESLAESELFGVVSGAYTGAEHSRAGYFEAAQGGILYLDEIDSMPLPLQAKLLRVLETRTVERLGSTISIELDVCVIASAQRALPGLVEDGLFRRDLYYRLNAIMFTLPPLRTQRDRVVQLFIEFSIESGISLDIPVPKISDDLKDNLLNHEWPGNIRELKSVAKRFVLGFPPLGLPSTEDVDIGAGLKIQLRVIEKILIQESLARNGYSIDAVSQDLDIPIRTLYHRIKSLAIANFPGPDSSHSYLGRA